MSNDKIKAARHQLGRFFQDRRMQMGRTAAELADHLEVSAETVKGVETGRFACDVDLLFKFCEALEIKPFFAPHEEIKMSSSRENVESTIRRLSKEDNLSPE